VVRVLPQRDDGHIDLDALERRATVRNERLRGIELMLMNSSNLGDGLST
jgi:hypothetical protein